MRLRLIDFRLSRGPSALGITQGDLAGCARIANAADMRLAYAKESGDEGWVGSWAEVVFSVDRCHPYITLPRGFARIEAIDVCGRPVPLNNSFYEYMLFGNGRMPKENRWQGWHRDVCQTFARNNAVTYTDLSDAPQQIQIYATNPADYGKRVLVQGISKGSAVHTLDGNANVSGEFITLANPFSTSQFDYDTLTGIQKDVTVGEVQIFQIDPTWGSMELLSVMEPGEEVASYRRYYIHQLPRECCSYQRSVFAGKSAAECGCPYTPKQYVLVTALVKLDLVPVTWDTDYFLCQNLEALIAEAQSVRFSEMDSPNAMEQSAERHLAAIRLRIGEQTHVHGKNSPSIQFKPFGSADLRRLNVAMR